MTYPIKEITSSFMYDFIGHDGTPWTKNCRIVWRSTGVIVCCEHKSTVEGVESNTTWCDHLEYWCKSRQDLDMLIRNADTGYEVIIPMVPSLDLWERVKLNRAEFDENVMIVNWQPQQGISRFLTHLRMGEGRLAVRESLFQAMLADPLRPKECAAAHHTFKAQMEFEHNMRNGKESAESWSLWRTLHCLWCNSNDASGDPDLIPPNQGNVWN